MNDPLSSNSPQTIRFAIPTNWTPQQALAVFNLLDELSHRIWAHYELHLVEELIEQDRPFLGLPERERGWHYSVPPDASPDECAIVGTRTHEEVPDDDDIDF
jgi:hypothetical protein